MPQKNQKSNTSGGSQQPQFIPQPPSRQSTGPASNVSRDSKFGDNPGAQRPPQGYNNYIQTPPSRGNPGVFNPGNSGKPYNDPNAFKFAGGGTDYNAGGPVSPPQPSGIRVGAHPRPGYASQAQIQPESQGGRTPPASNGYTYPPPNYTTPGKPKRGYNSNMQDFLKNDGDYPRYWGSNGGPRNY